MAKPRILIVDDQEEVRDAFSRALALDGYETRTAENVDSAMAAVEAMEPDAILLDFVMPAVGHELLNGPPRSEGAEHSTGDLHERARQALNKARKAAEDVRYSAEKARARRDEKKEY